MAKVQPKVHFETISLQSLSNIEVTSLYLMLRTILFAFISTTDRSPYLIWLNEFLGKQTKCNHFWFNTTIR